MWADVMGSTAKRPGGWGFGCSSGSSSMLCICALALTTKPLCCVCVHAGGASCYLADAANAVWCEFAVCVSMLACVVERLLFCSCGNCGRRCSHMRHCCLNCLGGGVAHGVTIPALTECVLSRND